jgi:CDP-paratose 2-epimerase
MDKRILVTGGAGFIGTNAAVGFARRGWEVTVLDNLSRRGADQNLDWLRRQANVAFLKVDVRDTSTINRCFAELGPFDVVLHLAAQVAVTTSVSDPRSDFEINALGTLNLLEAVRRLAPNATFVNASTNKVYGQMEDLSIVLHDERWSYDSLPNGVPENRSVDFHSPYGCSKGAAEQYVLDYARIYGMKTISFRQSCIYGPRQFGVEDQGWLAWFTIAAVLGRPITVFGDGRQVRDVLHVDDLVHAYEAAISRADRLAGHAFNIGGGAERTLSLMELVNLLEELLGRPIVYEFADWRPGDQRVYISDISKAENLLDWKPRVAVEQGVQQLLDWVRENEGLIRSVLV